MKRNRIKILHRISIGVLFVAFLNVFAFSVRHVVTGGHRFGQFTKPFESFIMFPLQVLKVYKQQTELPPYHVLIDDNFNTINNLENDLFALNAHYKKDEYVYTLSNLKTDSILHSWSFTKSMFKDVGKIFYKASPVNPILLKDRSIIGVLFGTKNIFRLDKESKIVWHNTSKTFHHSINISHDNYVWACTFGHSYTKNEHSNNTVSFTDEFLTKLDAETGEIVFDKSLSEILFSNGYVGLVHGQGNEAKPEGRDLFHLNDIQPALSDGEFWRKGDLFLSLRHRSMIILYRPETNKILRLISGPFLLQHDVDIISENKISIFNNNRTLTVNLTDKEEGIKDSLRWTLKSSDIVVYNFSDSTFSKPFLDLIQKEKIYTEDQGVHTFLSNGGLFIESTESGKIYILRDNEIIFKKYANNITENRTTEYPHWMSIYEKVNF